MRTSSRAGWSLALAMAAWLAVIPAANAYVDPGSTSLIFSWIVAGLAAAGMTLRIFWSRLKGLFRRDGQGSGDESEDPRPHADATQD